MVTFPLAPASFAQDDLLEQPQNTRFATLVPLKAGKQKPPIYVIPGLGGSVMDLVPLVEHLDAGHPVCGLHGHGMEGVSSPFDTIEENAQECLKAVKQVQPSGPYLFIGYSFGGLVMFEMAQRLSMKGERVDLLAMIDSYPHRSRLPAAQRLLLAARLVRRRALTAARSTMLIPGHAPKECAKAGHSSASRNAFVGSTMHGAYSALRRYKPRFYDGGIKFVRAEITTTFPEDPVPIWSHLAAEFDVETVPGDHRGMLTTHFENLASVLNRFLRCTLSEQRLNSNQ